VEGCKGDISFLTGLRWRAPFDREYSVLQFRNFFAVVFGYRRGPFTTKATGCALVFRKAVFSQKKVRAVSCPPAGVAGRGGLVRMVGGKFDITSIVYCSPPACSASGKEKAAQVKGAYSIMNWVFKSANSSPCRSTPICGGDLNSSVGTYADGRPWEFGGWSFGGGNVTAAGLCASGWLDDERAELCAANSFFAEASPTSVGEHGVATSIDHLFLPKGLLPAVQKLYVDWALGRKLSLIPAREPRDHLLVIMLLQYLLASPLSPKASERFCQEKLAACLQKGEGRLEFLLDLECEFQKLEPEFRKLDSDRAPDDHWKLWVDTVRAVALRHFSAEKKIYCTPEYEVMHLERLRLLAGLARERVHLGLRRSMPVDGSWTVQHWRLFHIQKRLRAIRRWAEVRRRDRLVVELREALRVGRKAAVQRLARLLAGTFVGIKKRKYCHLPACRPGKEELLESACSPACEGGLSAVEVVFEEECERMVADYGPLGDDLNFARLAKQDLRDAMFRMVSGAKRRASPEWSCPSEVFLCSVCPSFCTIGNEVKSGVGAETFEGGDRFLSCQNELQLVLEHVHKAGLVPLVGNLSLGFLIDKGNGGVGLKGQRLLHLTCAFWRNFFGAALRRGSRESSFEWPCWFHAYLPGRRREAAMLVQRAVQWFADRAELDTVNWLRDMKNAFACTSRPLTRETSDLLVEASHSSFFEQRTVNAVVRLEPHGADRFDVLPQSGNLIGTAEGPVFFSRSYLAGLEKWLESADSLFPPLQLRHPGGKTCRGDLVCFADDTFMKRVVCSRAPGELLLQMYEDDKLFDEALAVGGWKQNRDKLDVVPCLEGSLRNIVLAAVAKEDGVSGSLSPMLGTLEAFFLGTCPTIRSWSVALELCCMGFGKWASSCLWLCLLESNEPFSWARCLGLQFQGSRLIPFSIPISLSSIPSLLSS